MNNTNKRPIESSDGVPNAKKTKFGSPDNSFQGRNNFPSRGSFRGRGQFNRGRGGFNRGRGGFNRGRGGFNRGRGNSFQNFGSHRGSGPVQSFKEKPNCVSVNFPANASVNPALSEVLENCNQVTASPYLVTYWDPQDLIEKLPLLKEIKVDEESLKFKVTSLLESKTKKSVHIPRRYNSKKDNVKKFFNASSISDYPVEGSFILTFPSNEAASKAAKKVMVADNITISLKNYYEETALFSYTDDQANVKKLEEKLKTLAKEAEKKVEENSMEVEEDGSEDEENEDGSDDSEEGEEEEGEEESQDDEEQEEGDEDVGEEEEDEEDEEEEEEDEDDE